MFRLQLAFSFEQTTNNEETCKTSTACQAIPPAVAKSILETARAPRVSNLPCPDKHEITKEFNSAVASLNRVENG